MRSRRPQTVRKDVWYYENRGSLMFVVEVPWLDGGLHKNIRFTVPAYRLRRSLARMVTKKQSAMKRANTQSAGEHK